MSRYEVSSRKLIRQLEDAYLVPQSCVSSMVCLSIRSRRCYSKSPISSAQHLPWASMRSRGAVQDERRVQRAFVTKDADLRIECINEVVATYFSCVMLSHRWEEMEPLLVYQLKAVGEIVKLQSSCKIARDAGYPSGHRSPAGRNLFPGPGRKIIRVSIAVHQPTLSRTKLRRARLHLCPKIRY